MTAKVKTAFCQDAKATQLQGVRTAEERYWDAIVAGDGSLDDIPLAITEACRLIETAGGRRRWVS